MDPIEGEIKLWEIDKSLVDILKAYEAKITGENDKIFYVEFFDEDGSIVEAKMAKEKFKDLPYNVGERFLFDIVVYRMKNKHEIKASACPIGLKYWHESWLE